MQFSDISSGRGYTCGLRLDGSAVCWGTPNPGAAWPPANERFVSISSGASHACAQREDGTVVCWGSGYTAPHHLSKPYERPPAPLSDPVPPLIDISSGREHACALAEGGWAICWGDNQYGQASPPTNKRFGEINSGHFQTCGLEFDGELICWGAAGIPSTRATGRVAKLWDTRGPTRCVIDESGNGSCTGNDSYGQARLSGSPMVAISGGARHTCGLYENGTVECWGDDEYGQTEPPEGERFAAIAAGHSHTCGLRRDGVALCWGRYQDYDNPQPESVRFTSIRQRCESYLRVASRRYSSLLG